MQTLMPPVGTPDNKFHDGNPLTGEMGTIVEAAHLNNVQGAIRDTQSEIISILAEADIEPDGSTLQLLSAMKLLFAGNSDSLGALASLNGAANKLPYFTGNKAASLTDLTAVGRDIIAAATKDAVLQYLGLGDLPDFGAAAALNVATTAQMQAGTATDLLPSVAAVMSLFPKRVFAQNDFIRIPDVPGGLILQWGRATSLATGTGVTRIPFPIPYPTAPLIALPVRNYTSSASGSQANPTVNGLTTTGFDLNIADAVSVSAYWLSIGG